MLVKQVELSLDAEDPALKIQRANRQLVRLCYEKRRVVPLQHKPSAFISHEGEGLAPLLLAGLPQFGNGRSECWNPARAAVRTHNC